MDVCRGLGVGSPGGEVPEGGVAAWAPVLPLHSIPCPSVLSIHSGAVLRAWHQLPDPSSGAVGQCPERQRAPAGRAASPALGPASQTMMGGPGWQPGVAGRAGPVPSEQGRQKAERLRQGWRWGSCAQPAAQSSPDLSPRLGTQPPPAPSSGQARLWACWGQVREVVSLHS